MRALSLVKEYSCLGADKIMTMRNNLDVISKAIQDLVESKVCIKNEIITCFEKKREILL